jgi:hypothetical protein
MRSAVMDTFTGDAGAWAGVRKHKTVRPPPIKASTAVNRKRRILFNIVFWIIHS